MLKNYKVYVKIDYFKRDLSTKCLKVWIKMWKTLNVIIPLIVSRYFTEREL